jgi:trimeric autotransporter adhesin
MTPISVSMCPRFVAGLFLLACLDVAPAQCAVTYEPVTTGTDADVAVFDSCWWDRDGSGPLPPVLVFVGEFRRLGNTVARGVVQWDPVTGATSPIGSGVGPSLGIPAAPLQAVFARPNHDLVVGGLFATIDGIPANNIARWNGAAWSPLGGGVPLRVLAITELPNGDLVAGGGIFGGTECLWRWDGATWTSMGLGAGVVYSLLVDTNGDLLVGGYDLLGSNTLMRWDGAAWSPFPIQPDQWVGVMRRTANGDLVAGGAFTAAGGVPARYIARWNGTSWSPIGPGFDNMVISLIELPGGDLVAGGSFRFAGSTAVNRVARWNGTAWLPVGAGLGKASDPSGGWVYDLHRLESGHLVASGNFPSDGSDHDHVARFDGASWGPIQPGVGGAVHSIVTAANGDLIVAGDFTAFEGLPARRIVRRSGGAWTALGAGTNGAIWAVAELPNGDIVVGGDFSMAGGVPANRVARWNGSTWSAMGAGLPGSVRSIAADNSGRVLAAGIYSQGVLLFDGSAWVGTGYGQTPAYHWSSVMLLRGTNGAVFASSYSGPQPAGLSEWTGSGWQLRAPGLSTSCPMALGADGSVLVVSNGVRRWDGTTVQQIAGPLTFPGTALEQLPNGDVLIAVTYSTSSGHPTGGVLRWNGASWQPIGAGTDRLVRALRWQPDGDVLVGGEFAVFDGRSSGALGRLRSSCPAIVTSLGTGCAAPAGVAQLTPTTSPWAGATFRSRADGMPTNGLVVEVLGLGVQQQLLQPLLPQAAAACLLHTRPDVLRAYPSSASLELTLALPNSAAIVGALFLQQVVPLELDATGTILSAASSNALVATVGLW